MEANFTECRRLLGDKAGQNALVLKAASAALFGQQTIDSVRVSNASKQAMVTATQSVHNSQLQYRAVYQHEVKRLMVVQGTDAVRTQQVKTRVQRSGAAIDQLGVETELATIQEVAPPAQGTVWDGRIMDANQRGRGDVTVELVRADDTPAGVSGRTDAAGYYAVQVDAGENVVVFDYTPSWLRWLPLIGLVLWAACIAITAAVWNQRLEALNAPIR